jgi:hypothetical protein
MKTKNTPTPETPALQTYALQAIRTIVIPATNNRPTRIKAICARGGFTVSYDFAGPLDSMATHRAAANALCGKFIDEDTEKYGSDRSAIPWGQPFVTGVLENGDYCHAFLPKGGGA